MSHIHHKYAEKVVVNSGDITQSASTIRTMLSIIIIAQNVESNGATYQTADGDSWCRYQEMFV